MKHEVRKLFIISKLRSWKCLSIVEFSVFCRSNKIVFLHGRDGRLALLMIRGTGDLVYLFYQAFI